MENIITNFTPIEARRNYNKINNPLKLSVYELLSVGLKWNFNGKEYKIINGNKISGLLLKDKQNIAVIEEPYNNELNKAYIINGDNIIRYNVKEMLNNNGIIDDVYYIKNELYFFVIINNLDYKFLFDIKNGEMGELIFSK